MRWTGRRPAALAIMALAVTACGTSETPAVMVTRELPYTATASLDAHALPGGDGRPVVVMVHGCCDTRHDLTPLALRVAAEGAVVFNASWRNFIAGGSYPGSYQEVACAVRFARARASSFGGDPQRVTLAAWSDGAMPATVVANVGDGLGADCPGGTGSARPESLVTLAGFFGWTPAGEAGFDPAYVNERTVAFFGGPPNIRPDAWAAGNPYTSLEQGGDVPIRLVVGSDDERRGNNERFAARARQFGHAAEVVIVDGASSLSLLSTGLPDGRRAVHEIIAATRASGSSQAR